MFSFTLFCAVSTCITTCKKIAPPPVPPRHSTSKPFISVTVQSSTESAQDGYLDNHDRKSHTNGSSSDSSLTKGSRNHPAVLGPCEPQVPAALVLSPDSSRELQNEQVKAGGAADEPRTEPVPRRKLSSIGIQVGSSFRQDFYPFKHFETRWWPPESVLRQTDIVPYITSVGFIVAVFTYRFLSWIPHLCWCSKTLNSWPSSTGYLMLFNLIFSYEKKYFLHVVFLLTFCIGVNECC